MTFPLDRRVEINPHHDGSEAAADLRANAGSNVYSVLDGKVIKVGKGDSCGNTLVIEYQINSDTYKLTYCHLNEIVVSNGQKVKESQLVGKSGGEPGHPGAGNSRGPHLHVTVKKNNHPFPIKEFFELSENSNPKNDVQNKPEEKKETGVLDKLIGTYIDLVKYPAMTAGLSARSTTKLQEQIQRIKNLM